MGVAATQGSIFDWRELGAQVTSGLLRPTRLGNVLLATDAYPMRCYGMDGSLFWVHVETLADERLRNEVASQRLQLEIALAYATVFLLLTAACILLAPWIGIPAIMWGTAAALFAIASRAFYRSGVFTAEILSNSLCAACDLVRAELLERLTKTTPTERDEWIKIGQRTAYEE